MTTRRSFLAAAAVAATAAALRPLPAFALTVPPPLLLRLRPPPLHLPRQSLPREVSILLQELDPLLDADWYQKVVVLFKSLSAPQRTYAFANYLRGKGIQHDRETKKLVFSGRPGVSDLRDSISSSALQQVVVKLLKAEEMLRNTRNAIAFADLMESSISIIDNFDVQESLILQKEKQALRQAFLDDLVLIVRGSEFQIPENRRGLTNDIIANYFIQVYLKQQMQGAP